MYKKGLAAKLLACMLALVLMMTALSGCGQKEQASTPDSKQSVAQSTAQSTAQSAASTAESKPAQDNKPITLTVATAGDTNMLELFKNSINPEFKKKYPNVTVNVVGTGTGDAGSRTIFTKLKAQKDANVDKWDLDVSVVHQSIMADIIKEGLALKYLDKSANKSLVVGEGAKNSLGTNVDGYVIPMFQSQTVIAYNPKMVTEVPKNFQELTDWIKKNPKKFGYNGVKGGMSGVSFVAAYMYWKTGKYDVYAKGPYDKANEATWPDVMKELKVLPVTLTQGNAGTLDMLNRGEIAMGPVWVDMFYTWIGEGRMDPQMKLLIPEPGMPGQPMYFIVPAKSANSDMAIKYIDYCTSPEVQANVIVGKNKWYPGIDASKVLPVAPPAAKDELFKHITAEDLAKKGLLFPLAQYLTDCNTAYEEN